MLARMLLTPRVIIVRRATGAGGFWFMPILAALEQAQLLPTAFRPREMLGGQFRAPLVEPEFFAGDLEPASDHPGHRPGALHSRSPLRIIVAPAAYVADQRKDVAIAVGIIGHQPFTEPAAHLH